MASDILERAKSLRHYLANKAEWQDESVIVGELISEVERLRSEREVWIKHYNDVLEANARIKELEAEVEAKNKQIKELQDIIDKPPEDADWVADYHLLQSSLDGPIIDAARKWHAAYRKAQNSNLMRAKEVKRLRSTPKSGLYGKYIIQKADGSPVDPKADYFILRLDTDPIARRAALEYSYFMASGKDIQLAKDLQARVAKYDPKSEDAVYLRYIGVQKNEVLEQLESTKAEVGRLRSLENCVSLVIDRQGKTNAALLGQLDVISAYLDAELVEWKNGDQIAEIAIKFMDLQKQKLNDANSQIAAKDARIDLLDSDQKRYHAAWMAAEEDKEEQAARIKELQDLIDKPPEEADWVADYHLLQSALDGPIIDAARKWHAAYRKAQNSNLMRAKEVERLRSIINTSCKPETYDCPQGIKCPYRQHEIDTWIADRDNWITRYEAVREEKDARIADQEAYIERLEAAFLDSLAARLYYEHYPGVSDAYSWHDYPEDACHCMPKEKFREKAREALERIKEGGKDE